MKEELTEKVLEWAGKIEDVAPDVWKIAIKQAYVELLSIFSAIAVLVLFGVVFNWSIDFGVANEWGGSRSSSSFGYYLLSVISGIGLFILICVTMDEIITVVKTLINPKYYAIHHIKKMIKK
jgi:vacuolar-type H+-ATPase subunit I/STV1